jgi:phosphoglycerol geranylgeranyltransferase
VKSTVADWISEQLIKKKLLFMLLDPDRVKPDDAANLAQAAESGAVDALLIGSSLLTGSSLSATVKAVKAVCNLPVILFPGDVTQLSEFADAVLFLSLISGRNPQYLIGEHVKAAPFLYRHKLEAIPTGYILVGGGALTSVQFVSGTLPVPADKPDIASVHALAGQYLGHKLIYLEGGSGTGQSVLPEMVKQVRSQLEVPLLVGGGIENREQALALYRAGADILVIGNSFEQDASVERLREFSSLTEMSYD